MMSIIDFYNYVYIPRIWQLNSNAAIEKSLPTSKIILSKLNLYLNLSAILYYI